MGTLYDRADIYDLLETPARSAITRAHWEALLKGREIRSFRDVSIGTGGLTLPLAELGVQVSGSDLSEVMLDRCREKSKKQGPSLILQQADFRNVSEAFPGAQFDCVGSTGNSLPYVGNREIPGVLAQMDRLIRPGGWLYVGLRNWDRIVQEHQRFYFYHPTLLSDCEMHLIQVWDDHSDGSMDFNLIYTFTQEDKLLQKEVFTEHYYPLPRALLLDTLRAMGYTMPSLYCMPAQFGIPAENAEWYCILAQKPAAAIM